MSPAPAAADALELTADSPWPGLAPFAEANERYFHGREDEIAEIARRVRREPLTVLFGQSGLGKSSLIRAGVFPRLRRDGFVPVYIRLDFAEGAPPLVQQVFGAMAAAFAVAGVDAPAAPPGVTLWEYYYARKSAFWSAQNALVVPFLVFDQFEELFTLGRASAATRAQCAALVGELGDLVEARPPSALAARLEEDAAFARGFDFGRRNFKVLMGLREDFLPDFEALRQAIPSVMKNRLRLEPMSGAQALRSILGTGGRLVNEAVATAIVRFLAGQGAAGDDALAAAQIDPAILSVVCRELNATRQARRAERITADLLEGGAQERIIADFFERAIAGLAPAVRAFVEDQLLTQAGFRDTFALEDAVRQPGVTREAIDALVARRVLRVEDRFGIPRIELTHDVLTPVVKASRDSRQAREREAAQRRKLRRLGALAGAMALLFVASLAMLWRAVLSERESEARGRVADSQKLAATARNLFATEPDLAWLLAIEAYRKARTPEAMRTLLQGDALMPRELVAYLPRGARGLGVRTLAFSPDGDFIAGGGDDYDVRIWGNAHRGGYVVWPRPPQLLRTLREHRDPVTALAYSPDGSLLAAGAANGSVRVWDTKTWALARPALVADGTPAEVAALAFSGDGRRLFAGLGDGRLAAWDVAGWKARHLAGAHRGPVRALSADAGGRRLVSVGADDALRVWDAEKGEPATDAVGAPAARFRFAALRPEGDILAVTADGGVGFWSVAGRRLREDRRVLKSAEGIARAALSRDGRILAAVGADNELLLHDLRTGHVERGPALGQGALRALHVSDDLSNVAVGTDREVALLNRVWRRSDPRAAALDRLQVHARDAVAFSADGRRLYAVVNEAAGRRLVAFDAGNWKQGVDVALPDAPPCRSLSIAPDGRRAVIGCRPGNALSGAVTLIVDLAHPSPGVRRIEGWHHVTRDGARLLRIDGTLWSPDGSQPLGRVAVPATLAQGAPFVDDGRALFVLQARQLLRYDFATYRERGVALPDTIWASGLHAAGESGVVVVGTEESAGGVENQVLLRFDGATLEARGSARSARSRLFAIDASGDTFALRYPGHVLVGRFDAPESKWGRIELEAGMREHQGMRFSPDGKFLALQSAGEPQFAVFDVARARLETILFPGQNPNHFRTTRPLHWAAGFPHVAVVVESRGALRLVVEPVGEIEREAQKGCRVANRDLEPAEARYFLRAATARRTCEAQP